MEFEKFENILQKHRPAMQKYRTRVMLARVKVDVTEAVIDELKKQRQNLGGGISYELQKERNRITWDINEQAKKLKERQEELAAALRNDPDETPAASTHNSN